MKVGDLVKLSSYGKSVISNSRFIGPNDLGIILSISSKSDSEFPYEVRWTGHALRPKLHSRKDLKYASR